MFLGWTEIYKKKLLKSSIHRQYGEKYEQDKVVPSTAMDQFKTKL